MNGRMACWLPFFSYSILVILYVDRPQIQMGLNGNDTINKESLYSEYMWAYTPSSCWLTIVPEIVTEDGDEPSLINMLPLSIVADTLNMFWLVSLW